MKIAYTVLVLALSCTPSFAKDSFLEAEANFKWAMQKLLDSYVDKKITADQLYQGATAGMLASLNKADEKWNELLSPSELSDLMADMSGKVSGIGIVMKFDEDSGHSVVLSSIEGSPAEKAGLKKSDRILSVDGKTFKGKGLAEVTAAVRGRVGEKVRLRVLRGDEVLNVAVQRAEIPWTPVEMESIDAQTSLLTLGFFNNETPRLIEERLHEFNNQKRKRLIIDLRASSGGGFQQAISSTEYFLPENSVVASVKDRDGKTQVYKSKKSLLSKDVQVILITDGQTYCGSELFAAALREIRGAKTIGTTTRGKWNSQNVETLPNHYAMKYTIQEFFSPKGNTFQGTGMKPDLEVALPDGAGLQELRARHQAADRVEKDPQLKAALEFVKAS